MNIFLLLAVVGSAVAAPQFASPQFDTRAFAPQAFAAPQFAAQDARFSTAPVTSFAPPATGFQTAPVAGGRIINLDSSVFAPNGGVGAAPVFHRGFDGTTSSQPQITVVKRTEYLNDNGEFSSSFDGSNGVHVSETGSLKPTNDRKDNVIVKQGQYSYTSPDGTPVSVTYTADEYGFHPVSSSIPQAPVALAPTF